MYIFQSPAIQVIPASGDSRTAAYLDEIDDVFFNSPNPTSPYVVQMRQHPLARMASPNTPQLFAAAGDAPPLPAIQGELTLIFSVLIKRFNCFNVFRRRAIAALGNA